MKHLINITIEELVSKLELFSNANEPIAVLSDDKTNKIDSLIRGSKRFLSEINQDPNNVFYISLKQFPKGIMSQKGSLLPIFKQIKTISQTEKTIVIIDNIESMHNDDKGMINKIVNIGVLPDESRINLDNVLFIYTGNIIKKSNEENLQNVNKEEVLKQSKLIYFKNKIKDFIFKEDNKTDLTPVLNKVKAFENNEELLEHLHHDCGIFFIKN